MTIENVSRHSQTSRGEQNHPYLRIRDSKLNMKLEMERETSVKAYQEQEEVEPDIWTAYSMKEDTSNKKVKPLGIGFMIEMQK